VVLTLILLPALLPGLARGDAAEVPSGSAARTPSTQLASAQLGSLATIAPTTTTTSTTVAPTTTTTAPPPPPTTTTTVARTTTTTAPKPKPPVTTTTTTAPKPTTTMPPIVGTSQTGRASWYEQQPGVCAHRSLPLGTVVTITDNSTGASVTCTVGDRGPFVSDLIIDLAPSEFTQLAPTSVGVLGVTITW
jgi:rare lipoprotein A (peptidoglycan hydrolase)